MPFVHRYLLLVLAALLTAGSAFADRSIGALAGELAGARDSKLRVQAALALGQAEDPEARVPLERALDDDSVAVRMAAAIALRSLGDERAVVELRRHRKDPSAAVRKQVALSITALELKAERRATKPKYLVKLGRFSSAEERHRPVLATLARESRERLDGLPGVVVLDEWEDPTRTAQSLAVPVVLVSGHVRDVKVQRSGATVVYRAEVEFVVATMPERSIVGMISGSAAARAPAAEAVKAKRLIALRNQAVAAAVDSAIQRVSPAIEAAAR